MRVNKYIKAFLWLFLLLFCLANVIAYMHAYKLTHFTTGPIKNNSTSSFSGKLGVLFTGVELKKPKAVKEPQQAYQTIAIQGNRKLEAWYIKTESAIGSVILFHGYGGEKSSLLDRADVFLKMGFNTLLVDFRGSGNSEGNQTTIGYYEAEDVRDCYQYLLAKGETQIQLFGVSMGAVAIMRAVSTYGLQPSCIMLECPFGSMYQTVEARFRIMKVPSFPLAGFLLFWGGVQNGYWAFSHNPIDYANRIACPTLLLYGEQDPKVSREEINAIYTNLQGEKQLITYPLSGHESYLLHYKEKWANDVAQFLQQQNNRLQKAS